MKQQDGEKVSREKKPQDIKERTFNFALAIVRLCRPLEMASGMRTLSRQLIRAGTSIGANVEEAQAAHTRADFVFKYTIALKEARETIYWLRLLEAADEAPDNICAEMKKEKAREGTKKATYRDLIREATEISRVIGAIIVKTKT